MRGNEFLQSPYLRPLAFSFQIPMRGNEEKHLGPQQYAEEVSNPHEG